MTQTQKNSIQQSALPDNVKSEDNQDWQSQWVMQPDDAFLALFFNAQQHLMSFEELLCGAEDGPLVYEGELLVNDVVERALQHQAAGVTFMHYSPSFDGCLMPIEISIGQWLLSALEAVQVKLLDCLVMGKGGSISLMEKKLL